MDAPPPPGLTESDPSSPTQSAGLTSPPAEGFDPPATFIGHNADELSFNGASYIVMAGQEGSELPDHGDGAVSVWRADLRTWHNIVKIGQVVAPSGTGPLSITSVNGGPITTSDADGHRFTVRLDPLALVAD